MSVLDVAPQQTRHGSTAAERRDDTTADGHDGNAAADTTVAAADAATGNDPNLTDLTDVYRPGRGTDKTQATGGQLLAMRAVTGTLVAAPFAALAVAATKRILPSRGAVALGAALYTASAVGVSIGLHRYLTHRGFKTRRWTKAALMGAAAVSVEGSTPTWVANHRYHHQNSDTPADIHSPVLEEDTVKGLAKGFVHAHVGWLFSPTGVDPNKYAPDVLADETVMKMDRWWPAIALASNVLLPAGVGYAVGGTKGARDYLLWAGLIRMGLAHHVPWCVGSVCHLWGTQPFKTRDNSRNVAWLAIPTWGDSWHNLHHAEPSSARHGALRGEIDISAGVIRLLERAGLVWDVHWNDPQRLQRKLRNPEDAALLRPKPAPVTRPWIPLPNDAHRAHGPR